jgi:hypothetical protein
MKVLAIRAADVMRPAIERAADPYNRRYGVMGEASDGGEPNGMGYVDATCQWTMEATTRMLLQHLTPSAVEVVRSFGKELAEGSELNLDGRSPLTLSLQPAPGRPPQQVCLCIVDKCRLMRTCWPRCPQQRAGLPSSKPNSKEPSPSTAGQCGAFTSRARRCGTSPMHSVSVTNASIRSSKAAECDGGDGGVPKNRVCNESARSAAGSSDRYASLSPGPACTSATRASWRPSACRYPDDQRGTQPCNPSRTTGTCHAHSAARAAPRYMPS